MEDKNPPCEVWGHAVSLREGHWLELQLIALRTLPLKPLAVERTKGKGRTHKESGGGKHGGCGLVKRQRRLIRTTNNGAARLSLQHDIELSRNQTAHNIIRVDSSCVPGLRGKATKVAKNACTPNQPMATPLPHPPSRVHIPRPTTYGSLTGALARPLVVNSVHEAVGVIGDGPSGQGADQDGQQKATSQTRHHFHLKTQRI